jgi:uncharacterized protein involved in exopolysaccharide biosynthesis
MPGLNGLELQEALRSQEVLHARWPEIDLDNAVWAVSAARIKARNATSTPNPAATTSLSARARASHSPHTSLQVLLKRMQQPVHGFRSVFRDWGDSEKHQKRS